MLLEAHKNCVAELFLTMLLLFQNMELNRAQLLVHKDEAIERFRTKHGIPMNVHIEPPRPNEISELAQGNEN